MPALTALDAYLNESGPAALVLREQLAPVEGSDAVFFPPTFAKGDNFPGGYNIDGDPEGENVCLVDSVGSQANRIEPLFARSPYDGLIPQITVKAGERVVNLVDAGHRAGDAIVRSSKLQESLQAAFKALLRGDASQLAKAAPTSLVFGVWDSRDTQAKSPRLVSSTIRAFNVRRLTRSAQYVPAVSYVDDGLLEEPADNATRETYSSRGFIHVPATGSHGGVIAAGGIRRDATLSLAALRLLHAGPDLDATLALRRYVLGLCLVAFTAPVASYFRQGCILVLAADHPTPRLVHEVRSDGSRRDFAMTHDDALAYATATAEAFKVGDSQEVAFDRDRAKRDVSENSKKGKKEKAAKK